MVGYLSCPGAPALLCLPPGPGGVAPRPAAPALILGKESTHGHTPEEEGHSLHPS